jgi:signal transduction histidine kinase
MPVEPHFTPSSSSPALEEWTRDLAHDLRQPLSTIQSAVCYLKLILRDNQRAVAHLDIIEQQVCESDDILSAAVRIARKQKAQTIDGNFAFTKAATADVT